MDGMVPMDIAAGIRLVMRICQRIYECYLIGTEDGFDLDTFERWQSDFSPVKGILKAAEKSGKKCATLNERNQQSQPILTPIPLLYSLNVLYNIPVFLMGTIDDESSVSHLSDDLLWNIYNHITSHFKVMHSEDKGHFRKVSIIDSYNGSTLTLEEHAQRGKDFRNNQMHIEGNKYFYHIIAVQHIHKPLPRLGSNPKLNHMDQNDSFIVGCTRDDDADVRIGQKYLDDIICKKHLLVQRCRMEPHSMVPYKGEDRKHSDQSAARTFCVSKKLPSLDWDE